MSQCHIPFTSPVKGDVVRCNLDGFHVSFHVSFHFSFSETGKPRKAPGSAREAGENRAPVFLCQTQGGMPWLRGSVAPFPFDSRGFPVDSSMFPCQRVATCGNMAQHVATCVMWQGIMPCNLYHDLIIACIAAIHCAFHLKILAVLEVFLSEFCSR